MQRLQPSWTMPLILKTLVEQTMRENRVPGYAICAVKDLNVVYSKGFGIAELGGDRPVIPSLERRHGEITITVTNQNRHAINSR